MWLVFAAGAAACFGLRAILYQWTSKQPADRNVLLFGVYLCGAVVSFLLNVIYAQPWTEGAWIGLAMGAFSFVSNAAMHKGFSVGKASIVAILTGLAPVVVVLGAYLLWREKLTWEQGAAFVAIVIGILLIRYSGDLSFRELGGAHWALIAMAAFAITDLSGKQATMWGGQTLPTLVLMYGTGSLMFGAEALRGKSVSDKHAEPGEAVTISADRWGTGKTLLVGLAVGIANISGMVLLLSAFRIGVTGLVSAVIALNVLMVILYARVVLRDTFTRLEVAGMSMAVCGILALRLLG